MVIGANLAARGEHAFFHHPNIRDVTYVTQDDLVEMAAQGMESEAFGNVSIRVFGTLDEALAHVRMYA